MFKVGKKYVSWDTGGHNGGVWKMANTIDDLRSKTTRLGTYDMDLKARIGVLNDVQGSVDGVYPGDR